MDRLSGGLALLVQQIRGVPLWVWRGVLWSITITMLVLAAGTNFGLMQLYSRVNRLEEKLTKANEQMKNAIDLNLYAGVTLMRDNRVAIAKNAQSIEEVLVYLRQHGVLCPDIEIVLTPKPTLTIPIPTPAPTPTG
jgi:hypothetical protein